MDRCKHGRVVSPVYEDCPFCLDESKNNTEREELAAKCYVGLIACSEVQGTFEEIAERAFDGADAFIKVRNEERRK